MAAGRSAGASGGRTLKGRALQWLSQREHSRVELRRKLMRAARAEVEADAEADSREQALTCEQRVDDLLDWLEAHRYLSQERFVESRIHVRESRYGNLRIRQELKQHQLVLSAEAAQALRESELGRARAVLERKFGASAPADAHARARQMRFLTARGFSPEVVAQALRRNGAEQHATLDG